MSYQYIIGAISCSENVAYTGSFVKLQALGGYDREAQHQTSSLLNVTWGQWPSTGDIGHPSASGVDSGTGVLANGGSITIPAGSHIDGPIYSFKTMTDGGGWLAYYRKK